MYIKAWSGALTFTVEIHLDSWLNAYLQMECVFVCMYVFFLYHSSSTPLTSVCLYDTHEAVSDK